ncbi:hypothetical protein AF960_02760 [Listeria monocytogenes]|nr:hypothetical protein AF960_02760 [Listeria monocytogenes]
MEVSVVPSLNTSKSIEYVWLFSRFFGSTTAGLLGVVGGVVTGGFVVPGSGFVTGGFVSPGSTTGGVSSLPGYELAAVAFVVSNT